MATNPTSLRRYILGYSNLAGNQLWNAVTKAKNIGAYVQDEWQLEDNLNITYGIRFDVPFFTSNAVNNPQVDGYSFVDENGNPTKLSTSQLPSAKLMINPRFGFNYDVNGNKKTQLRGGLGLFSGRPAFVFVSNAVGNNGMQAGQISRDQVITGGVITTSVTQYPFSPNVPVISLQQHPAHLRQVIILPLLKKTSAFPRYFVQTLQLIKNYLQV